MNLKAAHPGHRGLAATVLAVTLAAPLALPTSGCSQNSPGDAVAPGTGGTPSGTGGKPPGSGSGGASGSGGTPSGSGGTPSGSGGTGPGSGGSPAGSGGGPAGSGGAESDASPFETGSGGDSSPGAGKVTCGSMRAMIPTTGSTEGLVITPDGTIYHSQSFAGNYISRIRPGMAEETNWVMVGAQVLGITYDPKLKVVYAGSRSRGKILKIEVEKTPPTVTELADAEKTVNGVTLGEDGAVYYADQGSGKISRVAADGTKTAVSATNVPGGPNGLAFGPDKKLYINQYDGKDVVRLTLDATGKETARETFITLPGNHGDGIAFDAMGRLYVTATGGLFQIGTDGKVIKTIPGQNSANLEFGAGALSCMDLYSGGNGGGLKVTTIDAPGMDVPWHRAP
jgi:sugar lactone lactonase YvrE